MTRSSIKSTAVYSWRAVPREAWSSGPHDTNVRISKPCLHKDYLIQIGNRINVDYVDYARLHTMLIYLKITGKMMI